MAHLQSSCACEVHKAFRCPNLSPSWALWQGLYVVLPEDQSPSEYRLRSKLTDYVLSEHTEAYATTMLGRKMKECLLKAHIGLQVVKTINIFQHFPDNNV